MMHRIRLLITTSALLGVMTLVSVLVSTPLYPEGLLLSLGTAILSAAGTYFTVNIRRGDKANGATLSFAYCIILFALFKFGIIACLAGSLANNIISSFRNKFNRDQHIFNDAISVVLPYSVYLAYEYVFLKFGFIENQSIEILVSSFTLTFLYHFLNVSCVAAAIAVYTGGRWRTAFRDLYETLPGYLAGAGVVAGTRLILMVFHDNLWVLLPAVVIATPMAAVILREQRYRAERDQEHEQRISEKETYIGELERGRAELQRRQTEIEEMYASTVEAFALAIDAKDRYTQEHIQRVKRLAIAIAQEMGLVGDALRAIEVGAALHDIGKIAIPEHILNKPGRLTADEFELIKRHAELGARILQPVHFPYPVMGVVRSHHEKWDGSGYPDGLKGEEIPRGGRILAVADVYDALTSDRPYRQGWSHERAVEYLTRESGTHFDPTVVDAFLTAIARDSSLCAGGAMPASTIATIANDINRASFEYLTIFEVSQALSVVRGTTETLEGAANKLRALYKASTCVVLLAEEGGDGLTARMVAGCNAEYFHGARADHKSGCTATVFQSGEGFVGAYESADLLLHAATDPWTALRSCVIAPLRSDTGVLGTINLYHESGKAFERDDLRILEAAASLIARALENAREFERNRESAYTDALTGLFNIRYLQHTLDTELERARHDKRPLTLLMLDLNHFKQINDRFGHGCGNDVLRELGRVFQGALRGQDLVARYAGDEFCVVLPGTSAEDARTVVHNLRVAVRSFVPSAPGGPLEDARLSVSVGAATFPQDGQSAEALLAHADAAMYADKRRRDDDDSDARPPQRLAA